MWIWFKGWSAVSGMVEGRMLHGVGRYTVLELRHEAEMAGDIVLRWGGRVLWGGKVCWG